MNLFLCHSSKDKDIVRPIFSELKKLGHTVFFDEWSLIPGDSLIEKLPEAIKDSGIFILFLSKTSMDSTWCKKELSLAVTQMLKSNQIRIITYRMERIDPPLILDDLVYIDAVTFGYNESVEKLTAAVQGLPYNQKEVAYSDVLVETQNNVNFPDDFIHPGKYYAFVRIKAKRFQHPRFYVRLTFTAPISNKFSFSREGSPGGQFSMIASAIHGYVLEYTEGPPGLEPGLPWILGAYSDQPVFLQDVITREENPFLEVTQRQTKESAV